MNKLFKAFGGTVASRKFMQAVCGALMSLTVVVLNKKLGLGMSDGEVYAIAGTIAAGFVAVIAGTAHEDAAAKRGGRGGVTGLLVLFGLLALTTGCVTIHERDPVTIENFDIAIEQRTADYERWKQALVRAGGPHSETVTADLKGIGYLQEAAIEHLNSAKFRETKKIEKE